MDATKLIEEAEALSNLPGGTWEFDLATNRIEDRGQGGAGPALIATIHGRDDEALFVVRARTLVPDLAAALKASEERAKAAELDAASLRAAWKIADRTSLTAECQAHAKTSFDLLGVVKERDALAAANVAANKRIVELEHERDAARAELARLTTPRPIADAPRDGKRILAYMPSTETWMVLVWLVRKECWACPDFPHVGYYDPSHYLPLPEVKP